MADANPNDKKPLALTFEELGATGLAVFSGRVQEDFLRELRGREGYKRFREMTLNSPVVGALILANEQAIRRVKWTFTSETDGDPRVDLLNTSLDAMTTSFNDHIIEALTMLPFGFALFEIVYQRVGAQVLWRKLAIRGQETVYRWELDDSGGLVGIVQQAPPTYAAVPIPIEKLVLYRTRVERNNPEGRSILRTAWVPYYYAKHIQQVEAIGIERDLAGLPVITLPDGADTTDSATSDLGVAKDVVRNVRNDEQAGVVMPNGWDLKLLSTGGSRQFDTDKTIRRYEQRILMSALAQFLALGQDGTGSYALSTDQTDFFTMSVNALADNIAATFLKYPVNRLLALNGYDAEGIKFEHSPAGDLDGTVVAEFIQKVGAYLSWAPEDEVWLRGVLGLPERDVEDLRAEMDAEKQREADAAARLQEARAAAKEGAAGVADANTAPTDPSADPNAKPDKTKLRVIKVADAYGIGSPPDDRQRIRRERELRKAIAAQLERTREKVMKYARTLR